MKKRQRSPMTRKMKSWDSQSEVHTVVALAWADRITFEEIAERTGHDEASVIGLMRRALKPRAFKAWRARVSGRATKHRKRFEGRPSCRQKHRRKAGFIE